MAEEKKDGLDSVKLPGDEITTPRELNLPLDAAPAPKPATEPKPKTDAPQAVLPKTEPKTDAAPAAKKTDAPAAAADDEVQAAGPDNNYGIESPTSSSPDAWLEFDEKVANAKDAYDKAEKAKAKAAKDAAPAAAPAEAPVVDTPPVAGEYQPPAAREAPATLAADEKFALEPGAEWTRGQIVGEIMALRGIRDERDKAINLFGLKDYAALEAGWKPFLDKARANPGLVPFLDKMQEDYFRREEDPEYKAYVEENEAKFDEYRAQNPIAGGTRKPAAAIDASKPSPEMERIALLEKQISDERNGRENRANLERLGEQIKTERLGLWKTYPVLEKEPALWTIIKDHAIQEATRQREATGRPATYTLTDAVRDKWPIVLKFLENAKAATGESDTPMPVRAGGAESTTVRTSDDPGRERVYATKEDAAKAWALEYPNGFTG